MASASSAGLACVDVGNGRAADLPEHWDVRCEDWAPPGHGLQHAQPEALIATRQDVDRGLPVEPLQIQGAGPPCQDDVVLEAECVPEVGQGIVAPASPVMTSRGRSVAGICASAWSSPSQFLCGSRLPPARRSGRSGSVPPSASGRETARPSDTGRGPTGGMTASGASVLGRRRRISPADQWLSVITEFAARKERFTSSRVMAEVADVLDPSAKAFTSCSVSTVGTRDRTGARFAGQWSRSILRSRAMGPTDRVSATAHPEDDAPRTSLGARALGTTRPRRPATRPW